MISLWPLRNRLQRRPAARQAFTLLEMIATLGTLLVLAMAATTMLARIMDIGLQHRRSLEQRRAILRFAETLRADVAQAMNLDTSEGQHLLRADGANRVVEYRWNEPSHEIRRVVRSDSDSGDSESFDSADVFPLTDQCNPRVSVDDDRVTIVLRESEPLGSWIVEARR